MSPRLAHVVVLLALASACHRRAARPRHAVLRAQDPHATLQVAPADGPAVTLDDTRAIVGAVRIEGMQRAGSPYPATPFADITRGPDGWRFTSRDGSVYAANTFVGPLRVVGHDPTPGLATQPLRVHMGSDASAPREDDVALLRRLPLHARTPLPLPAERWEAAGRTDGHVDVLRGDEIVRYHRDSRAVITRSPAPGTACTLHRAWLGTRAVCTPAGWARAVFAEERRWTALRDELHAQPLGEVAFDPRSPLWAVGAACNELPAPQGNRACVYRPDGTRADVTLPFDGSPVAVFDGGVLFVETLRDATTAQAAFWRSGTLTPLTLPATPAAARQARWEGDALTLPEARGVVRVWLQRDRVRRSLRLDAPTEARAVVLGDGVVFAVGPQGAWRVMGHRFVVMPVAFEGHRGGRDLAAGEGFCAGPWCRLSDALWWSAAGIEAAAALAHPRAEALSDGGG
ncbi:MAG: hypothetical protein U0325_26005 [Polyangiales bacterium]